MTETMFGNCACPYDGDYETPDFYNERWVKKARKEHKCTECFRTIKKGDSYQYGCGAICGDIYEAHICKICYAIAEDFFPHCGRALGHLWDDLWNQFSENGEDNSWLEVPRDDETL